MRRMRLPAAFLLLSATAHAAAPADAVRLGRCAHDMPVAPLVLSFAPRDPAGLAALIAGQQDPRSPDYRRWLTPDEFAARFGTPDAAWTEAQRWLLASGFTDVRPWPGGLAISFRGATRDVERAFGVALYEYDLHGEKRVAPEGVAALPVFAGVAPRAVLGLDTFARVRPHAQVNGQSFFAPADIATVFGLGAVHAGGTTGSGVKIAFLALSDFDVSLVADFRRGFGLPVGTVEKRFASSQPSTTQSATVEALLDAQWAGAAAPGASILAEIAASDSSLALIEAVMDVVSHNLAPIVSISLGLCEQDLGQAQASVFDDLDQQAVVQGQSVLVASGDSGVTDCANLSQPAVNALAASPSVTAVGGTTVDPLFDASGNATGYGGEVVWNDGGGAATGGGLSLFFPRPDYQTTVGLPAGTTRGIPDVAFPASAVNPGYAVVTKPGGQGVILGGTSVATPIWSGMVALLVQQRGRLGLLNPELYRLGLAQAGAGTAVFHDVTMGNNAAAGVPGFMAGPGFDLVTGWGSFDAPLLASAFAGGCTDDRACTDGDPCSANHCTAGTCIAARAPDGTICDPDECLRGTCQTGTCGSVRGARGDQAVTCVLGNARFQDLACVGVSIPAGVTKRLDRVGALLARTDTGNARRKLRRARRLLASGARAVKRNKRLAGSVCGLALRDRLAFALMQLGRIMNAG
jgi:subtilase family serine protease